MARRRTPEEAAWLAERYATTPNRELVDGFEERFGWRPKQSSITDWAHDRGLKKQRGDRIDWAAHPEYDEFMVSYVPGHSAEEVTDEFARRFGVGITVGKIKNRKSYLGIKSGTVGGRFEAGSEPHNKGKTWDELGYDEEKRRRMSKAHFKAGQAPWTGDLYPLGSERVSKDGYVEVKVREHSPVPCTNKCWVSKHRVVWERENGRRLPRGWVVLFADGDKRNFDPDNLVAIPQRVNAIIQTQGLEYCDRRTLETAIAIAELKMGIGRASRRERPCATCGKTFKPRFENQINCDSCIADKKNGKGHE